MIYNADYYTVQFCNDTNWVRVGSGSASALTDGDKGDITVSGSGTTWMLDDDVLDFTELSDTLTLDASTSITASGTNVLSLTNSGTGLSLRVNDDTAADTTPFVIDAAGNVGIGTTSPGAALQVFGFGTGTSVAVSGTTDPTMNARFGRSAVSIDLGMLDSGVGYIQNRNIGNFATNYSLALQPNGGNVGIGTTTPTAKLDVANATIRALDSATQYPPTSGTGLEMLSLSGIGYLFEYNRTGSAYGQLRIDGSTLALNAGTGGNVGIGTTSPQAVLQVDSLGDTQILNHLGGSTTNFYTKYAVGGTVIGSVTSSGGWTSVAYNTTSDRRLKENIAETVTGLDVLQSVRVRDFNFIANPRTRVQGFIAQELYEVYPEAVAIGGDDPETTPWSVDYGRLTPLTIKAIQELKADNDSLREDMKVLRAEIEALKAAR